MKTNRRKLMSCMLVPIFIALLTLSALSAEWKTIVGTVSDYYQIETDEGDVYDVAENAKGDALSEQLGVRVKVTGTVEDEDYRKIITISSYTILGDNETAQEDVGGEEIAQEEPVEDIIQEEGQEDENVEEEETVEENLQEVEPEEESEQEAEPEDENEQEEEVEEEESEEGED